MSSTKQHASGAANNGGAVVAGSEGRKEKAKAKMVFQARRERQRQMLITKLQSQTKKVGGTDGSSRFQIHENGQLDADD